MLIQYVEKLAHKRIILASASPRRKELLNQLGLKFEVLVSSFEETLPKSQFKGKGHLYAMETARGKALDVAAAAAKLGGPPVSLIISADTVVELGDDILEKPDDNAHAFRMLSSLSGHEHNVHTGVVLVLPGVKDPATGQPPLVRAFSTSTAVTFDDLSDETINAYIATGEPFGKAGSYGIQGTAGSFVKQIKGCYFSVMGFPVHDFAAEVARLIKGGLLKLD